MYTNVGDHLDWIESRIDDQERNHQRNKIFNQNIIDSSKSTFLIVLLNFRPLKELNRNRPVLIF